MARSKQKKKSRCWFKRSPVIPVLRFSGPIGMSSPLRPGVSMASVAASLERAFTMSKAKAVAVQINSPGGSPVQSMLIYQRIRALATENNLKVYVFAEDVAASGGYMLACAGDEIYADPSSIIGSIGVISAGFGFHELIQKYGIERRVHTAGSHKMSLDPFQPEKPEDIERLKSIQLDIHQTFIDLVKSSRGDKLSGAEEEIFSGAFWGGAKAQQFGLIDGLSDVRSKMQELFGEDVNLKLISTPRGLFRRKASGVSGLWADYMSGHELHIGDEIISSLETRALWARYGL